MKTIYTEKDITQYLINLIGYKYTQKTLAKELGVSQGYLSDVFAGKRGIGDTIINKLGYQKVYIRRNGETKAIVKRK